jgi:hypothetical protein
MTAQCGEFMRAAKYPHSIGSLRVRSSARKRASFFSAANLGSSATHGRHITTAANANRGYAALKVFAWLSRDNSVGNR